MYLFPHFLMWQNSRNLLKTLQEMLTPQPVHVEVCLEQRLSDAIGEAVHNPLFKARLLADPKQTLATMKVQLPPEQSVTVLESTAEQTFLVLPVMTDREVAALQEGLNGGRSLRATRSRILLQAWQEPAYRLRLLVDPKGVMKEAGFQIPDAMAVKVLENTSDHLHLVIPSLH